MSKEAIIEKIISDAEARASAVLEEARIKADEIIATAASECKEYLAKNKHEIDVAVAEIASRNETVAELDARKLGLGAKSRALDLTYARVLEKLNSLDKKTLKALLLGMLDKAEDGDVVIISENEKDIVTEKVVADVAKKKGITLTLSKTFGDFDGGMVLAGAGVDKNLTFEAELDVLREDTEGKVAKELFD